MIVILVHPGSLIAAKSEVGFNNFEDILEKVLSAKPENRFLVTGGMIPENEYPITKKMGDLAKEVNPPIDAEPFQDTLVAAAKTIWKKLKPQQRKEPILITGAWADPDHGCATCIHETLLKLGAKSSLSEFSPIWA